MSDLAIRVEGLSKSFRLGHKLQSHRFTEFVENIARNVTRIPRKLFKGGDEPQAAASNEELFWALQDVSFDVHRGEIMGFIGRNGAGKSTLLKLLSRIMHPTRGRIEIQGRVRSLLEVGTGFHQDLTGRENVYLNGAVLGMTRNEIRRKFDEIVAFSEVEKFLDTPVKYYSSGMYVRLAFAVAAHLEPEILIIDEVLAVGDAAFQQKCMGKMGAESRKGKTVLIVSHSLPVITNLCQRALLLEAGRVATIGPASEVVQRYISQSRTAVGEVIWSTPETAPGDETAKLHAVRIFQEGTDGPTADVDMSKEIKVQISYWNLVPDQQLFAGLWLKDAQGTFVFSTTNVKAVSLNDDPWYGRPQPVGLYHSTCTIPKQFLNERQYQITVLIGRVPGKTLFAEHAVLSFDVHDAGDMHAEYFGNYGEPIIRPRLPWDTIRDGEASTP